jgi:(R,R)-butanediol dehydrogenase / meso-butanediol dehydrogenase / diacetyl reductase
MLAAVLHAAHDLRIEEVPKPTPAAGEVLVRVAHNGICGSDLKLLEMGLRATTVPHVLTNHCGPQILGHEFAGVIEQLGMGVNSLQLGERVCIQPNYHCGSCHPCLTGFTHLCQIVTFHGVISGGGGLSQFTTIPASMVHRLPDQLSMAQGALIEPMAVSHHAVERSSIDPGEMAVVFGGGPIGIGVVLGLRARGVTNIAVVEPVAARRSVAKSLGAHTIDPNTDDLRAYLSKCGWLGGSDVSFDCAGIPATFGGTLESLRARGRAVIVAGSSAYPLTTTAHLLQHTEITITGSLAFTSEDFRQVISLMADGAYPTEGWVEHIEFGELVEEGFGALAAGRRTKVLVDLPA